MNDERYRGTFRRFGGRQHERNGMPKDRHRLNETVSALTNALQVIAVLATKLKRELSASADDTVLLEAAAERAVKSVQRLREG